MEKISFRPKTSVKTIEEETPQELESALKIKWQQLPKEEECYKIIDQKVEEKAYLEAKTITSILMKKYMKEGRSLSPQLKEYILSDWYKATHIEEGKEARVPQTEDEKGKLNIYENIPAIVVGRNPNKRIINVAWGREQEGFFKWHFRTPLPNYNDALVLDFEQRETRGIMNVKRALALEGEASFPQDFYRIDEVSLETNEANEFSYQGTPLPRYLFDKEAFPLLKEGDKAFVHWIYKFQPKDQEFNWSIIKAEVAKQEIESVEAEQEKEEKKVQEETPQATSQETEEPKEPAIIQTETHSLIINDIPLRNGELTCRCLTAENELIYFRKSLTKTEVNRLDKLVITGLVRHDNFGKQFIKILAIKEADDKDFPETILRKRVKRLHKEGNNIFLDDEQLAARKVQLLRLKHLMMKEQSNDFSVLVEEMYLYAVHIKDYEWTIADVRAVKAETISEDTPPSKEKEDELSPEEKQKQAEALRQPWQVRVAYITKVDEELGRVEIVYGIKKKGYIALEDFPITSPYKGDWLGMKMLDGKEPMHEIVFDDVIRLDPNKRLPNTSKLIYKVRRGVLWFSEQDQCFKLHNAPINQEVILAMEEPKYKDYFLIEELLDYDEELDDFAWRLVKVEKFEYLDPIEEMEGHIYPMKFRQEEVFQKALAKLKALAPKKEVEELKEEIVEEVTETKVTKEEVIKSEVIKETKEEALPKAQRQEREIVQQAITISRANVSFCPQRVSKHRRKKVQDRARGVRGLGLRRKQA